jgi:beta-phosphoglucomutase-like phosphatase (HAD superfamily)
MTGIIFDFDGLILDTESPMVEAVSVVSRSYGASLGLAVWAQFIVGQRRDEEHLRCANEQGLCAWP